MIFMSLEKVWTKEEVKELIATKDEMVRRGLLVIFALQTADEKNSEHTTHTNGVGFTGFDGELMSSFAHQLKEKGYLSPKQLEMTRKKLVKYASQLAKVANGELEVNDRDLEYKKTK